MAELLGELLERCRGGEPDAVTTLVRRFQGWALDLASALLGDEHLAEDAVQGAFVRALGRLPDLRDPAAFPAWFRQIIRTEVHRIARREGLRRGTVTQACLGHTRDDTPQREPHPPEVIEQKELCRLVRQAVAALPPAARDAAELFYLDELDCAEVAERLRVPAGTVKRRLHDARIRLREMLLGEVKPVRRTPDRPKPPETLL